MTRTFKGVVTSILMTNTAVVEVSRKTPHPLYKKLLTRSKKHKIETDGAELMVGDTVIIAETKPLSKGKHFRLSEVVTRIKEEKHG